VNGLATCSKPPRSPLNNLIDELFESLEEAVVWWRVLQIIVCGHSSCGAMKEHSPGRADRSTHPATWYQAMVQRMGESNRLLGKAKRHTRDQLMALGRYPFIENAIHEQNLKLLALFYLHGSGLFLQDEETQEVFLPLM
jgi:carbonic anhydrase